MSLTYEPLNLNHVLAFRDWGRHTDPRFDDYNFYEKTVSDCEAWLAWKTGGGKYYTVLLDQRPIGYVSFKRLPRLGGRELGVVFDPNYVSQGYGSEALQTMIRRYFEMTNYTKLYLSVARYNIRARRLYDTLGFQKTHTTFMKYDNPRNGMEMDKNYFFQIMGMVFFYVDHMVLRRSDCR
ncbi:GNAT family N-acetyltransferase [Peptoniphilus equinus]|uniref:GNAT family N-acetyltransferase n=1 Tax=Peptoniphilus equinus TaxID=3016343 RepID=A0ABY7QUH5_9FIRM|nr:GNAT family N-acetyltransferase [Peptoniphilus equinus]WBW50011.1 GNAT family N-acetyltransferase [Peptoniphilus equinus]